jgi:hypothetical protein
MKHFFLIAALSLTVTGFTQKVSGKLNFPKGQKIEMVTEASSVISMEVMGQSMDTKVNVTVFRNLDIEDVSDGNAVIEHKMKRMKMNFESPMAGSQTFDSDNEKDMKGDGGKAMEKALKNKYKVTVDANGTVTAVQADDNNPNKTEAKPSGDMMASTMDQMGMSMELPKVGEASEFKILPENEVGKGDSWSTTTGKTKTTFTVADITDTDIILNFTSEGSTENKQDAGGMEIMMSTKDKSNGQIVIDRKTGLLKKKTENIESDGTMEMMGQSMPMKTKATRVTTATGL